MTAFQPRFTVMREGRTWFVYGPTRMRVAGPYYERKVAMRAWTALSAGRPLPKVGVVG